VHFNKCFTRMNYNPLISPLSTHAKVIDVVSNRCFNCHVSQELFIPILSSPCSSPMCNQSRQLRSSCLCFLTITQTIDFKSINRQRVNGHTYVGSGAMPLLHTAMKHNVPHLFQGSVICFWKYFLQKYWRQKFPFLAQHTVNLCIQKIIITLFLKKNVNCLPKIGIKSRS
jgi:hypothetical protein